MIKKLVIAGLALVVLTVGTLGYVVFLSGGGTEPVDVDIPRGSSTIQIAEILKENEVIGSTLGFRILAKIRGREGKIQAGRYELTKQMGSWDALGVLARPPVEKGLTVGFPEGFSLRQIGDRLKGKTHIKDFTAVATSGKVRAQIQPPNVTTLEGFLFPETYVIGEREDAAGIAKRMVEQFESRTSSLDWSAAESKGLSRYDALIIASLIEREARVDEDRAKVSAVIYNRLEKGMRLQIDITALYGLDEHKVPTRADLRRESPYNTYLIDGLPPTPIANPGLDSLEAALHPADTDDIYYVVIDPSGRHGFTSDPQEFERLKQQRPPEVH